MLKRITVSDLRIGMYIDEFCGSWMDHPFWRAHFVVDNEIDLEKIRDSRVREVRIDASKGLDVDPVERAQSRCEEADRPIDAQFNNALCAEPSKPTPGTRQASTLGQASCMLAEPHHVAVD